MSELSRHLDVRMRRARPQDADAIAAVFDAAVRAAWTYLGPSVEEPLFAADDWDRLIADHAPPNVLLVAEGEDREGVIGFVAAHPHEGELFLLFVHPRRTGRGVARRLIDAAHETLRGVGRRRAFLFTHVQNAHAIAVYQRAGYVHDGTYRESEFRGAAVREQRMVKDLDKN